LQPEGRWRSEDHAADSIGIESDPKIDSSPQTVVDERRMEATRLNAEQRKTKLAEKVQSVCCVPTIDRPNVHGSKHSCDRIRSPVHDSTIHSHGARHVRRAALRSGD